MTYFAINHRRMKRVENNDCGNLAVFSTGAGCACWRVILVTVVKGVKLIGVKNGKLEY